MSSQSTFHHYLPVSRIAVESGVYLAGGGREIVRPGQPYPPNELHPKLYAFSWRSGRVLPEYQVLLIQNGKGEFESESVGQKMVTGDNLLLLFPNVWHRYRTDPRTGWTERWISFNGELVHRMYDALGIGPESAVVSVTAEASTRIARRFDDFLDRMHANLVKNPYLLSMHMMSLVAEALECVTAASSPDPDLTHSTIRRDEVDPLVAEALEYIWTHSNRPISVAELARRMSVKRRTLDRHFSSAMGHSILVEINRCRLARAKRLLRETNMPIKAVAHLAGFTSQERLRVSFAESEGISPSEFRSRYGRVPLRRLHSANGGSKKGR